MVRAPCALASCHGTAGYVPDGGVRRHVAWHADPAPDILYGDADPDGRGADSVHCWQFGPGLLTLSGWPGCALTLSGDPCVYTLSIAIVDFDRIQ